MDDLQFIRNIDGKNVVCDTICTYYDEDTKKNYIVFTDRTFNKENKLNVYYSLYEMQNNKIKLIQVETNEDKKIGLELIQEVLKEIGDNNGNK